MRPFSNKVTFTGYQCWLTFVNDSPMPVPSWDLLTDCTRWKRSPMRWMSEPTHTNKYVPMPIVERPTRNTDTTILHNKNRLARWVIELNFDETSHRILHSVTYNTLIRTVSQLLAKPMPHQSGWKRFSPISEWHFTLARNLSFSKCASPSAQGRQIRFREKYLLRWYTWAWPANLTQLPVPAKYNPAHLLNRGLEKQGQISCHDTQVDRPKRSS